MTAPQNSFERLMAAQQMPVAGGSTPNAASNPPSNALSPSASQPHLALNPSQQSPFPTPDHFPHHHHHRTVPHVKVSVTTTAAAGLPGAMPYHITGSSTTSSNGGQDTGSPASPTSSHSSRQGAVDYLSYAFNEFDLHQCWRNATRHKDSIINGRRLENASWRKFFQMKFGLATIDPATLNWQKDSDVCWLYGPFHTYDPLPVLQAAYANAVAESEKDLEPHTHHVSQIHVPSTRSSNSPTKHVDITLPRRPIAGPTGGNTNAAGSYARTPGATTNAGVARHSNLKPALKKHRTRHVPDDFLKNLREQYLRNRSSSDPDLISTSAAAAAASAISSVVASAGAQASGDKVARTEGNTAMSTATDFYAGRKADFFLAYAERDQTMYRNDDLVDPDLQSNESKRSESPTSTKQLRFAEEVEQRLIVNSNLPSPARLDAPSPPTSSTRARSPPPPPRASDDEDDEPTPTTPTFPTTSPTSRLVATSTSTALPDADDAEGDPHDDQGLVLQSRTSVTASATTTATLPLPNASLKPEAPDTFIAVTLTSPLSLMHRSGSGSSLSGLARSASSSMVSSLRVNVNNLAGGHAAVGAPSTPLSAASEPGAMKRSTSGSGLAASMASMAMQQRAALLGAAPPAAVTGVSGVGLQSTPSGAGGRVGMFANDSSDDSDEEEEEEESAERGREAEDEET
ncbi:hypothetical protein HK101_008179, partial [Irineochytrium annulatum]